MSDKKFGVIVTGDTEDIQEKLSGIVTSLAKIVDKIVNLDVNVSDEGLNDFKSKLDGIPDSVRTIIEGDDQLSAVIESLQSKIDIIDDEIITVAINAEDNASDIATAVKGLVESMDGEVSTITLQADGDDAESTANSVKSILEELDGLTSTVVVEASDNASDDLSNIQKEMEELDGKTSTVNVEADTTDASNSITDLTSSLATGITALVGYDQAVKALNFDKAVEQSIIWGNATADNKNQIEDLLRSLSGARFKLDEVGQAYAYLTRATGDWKAASLELPQILSYVKISGGDLETTIYNLTTVFEKYNMSAEEATKFTGYLADMINQTKLTGNEFDRLLVIMSRDLAQVGFDAYDTAALIAAFDKSGVSAQEMMRASRQGFNEFITNFREGSPKIQQIEADLKKMGISARDANGNLRPTGEVLQEIMQKMAEYPEGPEKMRLANELFGTGSGKVFSQLKVNYKDLETQAKTSGANTAEAINQVGKEHQQAAGIVENESQKIMSWLGKTGAQFVQWATIILGSITTVILGLGAFGSSVGKVLDAIFDTSQFGSKMKGWQDIIRTKFMEFGSKVLETIKGWAGWGDEAGKSAETIGKAIEGKVDNPTIITKLKDFGSRVLETIRGWKIWSNEAGTIDMVKGLDGTWEMKAPSFLEKVVGWGRNLPGRLSEAISSVGFKLPALESMGLKIPEGLSAGLLRGIPKLIGDAAIPLAVIQSAAEGLYHYTDMLSSNPVELLWNIYLGGTYNLLPQQLRDFIDSVTGWATPEKLGKAVFGEDFYNGFVGWFTDNVVNPFRSMIDNLPAILSSFLSGGVKIDLIGWIFGAQPGEDPNDISTTLVGNIVNNLSSIPEKVIAAFAGFNLIELLTGGWANFTAFLSTLPAQIMAFLGQIPTILQNSFSSFMAWLAALPENLGRAVGDAIVLVLQGVYTILKTIMDLPGQAAEAIKSLGAQIVAAVGNIGPTVQAAWGSVTKVFSDFLAFITGLPGQVLKGLTDLGNQIVAGLNSIPGKAKSGLDGIIDQFKKFVEWLEDLPGAVYDWIVKTGDQIWKALSSIPNRVRGGVDDIIDQFEHFIDWLKGLPDAVMDWIKKTFDDMVDFIKSIPDKVLSALNEIWQKFVDFLNWIGTLPSQLYNAIVNAWEGFLKGLKEKFPQISEWLQKIRDLFPHSPPKTGPLVDIMDWGSNMSDAIQSGFDKSFPYLESSFVDKIQRLKDIGEGLSADMGDLSAFSMSEQTMQAVNNPTNEHKTELNFGDIKVQVDKLDVSSPDKLDESVNMLFEKFYAMVIERMGGTELPQRGLSPFKLG